MRVYSINSDIASVYWNQRKNSEEISFTENDAEIIGPDGAELLSDLELEELVEALERLWRNIHLLPNKRPEVLTPM